MNTINLSSQWQKIGSWHSGDPYTFLFVYPFKGDPYIIKGGLKDCETKLKEDTRPLVYFRTFFHRGTTRAGESMHSCNLPGDLKAYSLPNIDFSETTRQKRKFIFLIFNGSKTLVRKTLRRIPRRFPEDLIKIIQG